MFYLHLKYFMPPIATSVGLPSGSCEEGPMCCSLQYSLLFLASQTNHELVNQGSKQPQADGCQETSGECPWLWLSLTLSWSTCCTLGLTWSGAPWGRTPGEESLACWKDDNGGWSSLLRQDSRRKASTGLLDKLRVPTRSHPAQGHTRWETGDEELLTAPYICSFGTFPSCYSNL